MLQGNQYKTEKNSLKSFNRLKYRFLNRLKYEVQIKDQLVTIT